MNFKFAFFSYFMLWHTQKNWNTTAVVAVLANVQTPHQHPAMPAPATDDDDDCHLCAALVQVKRQCKSSKKLKTNQATSGKKVAVFLLWQTHRVRQLKKVKQWDGQQKQQKRKRPPTLILLALFLSPDRRKERERERIVSHSLTFPLVFSFRITWPSLVRVETKGRIEQKGRKEEEECLIRCTSGAPPFYSFHFITPSLTFSLSLSLFFPFSSPTLTAFVLLIVTLTQSVSQMAWLAGLAVWLCCSAHCTPHHWRPFRETTRTHAGSFLMLQCLSPRCKREKMGK